MLIDRIRTMTHITTKDYVYAMSKDNAPVARVKPNQTFSVDTSTAFAIRWKMQATSSKRSTLLR